MNPWAGDSLSWDLFEAVLSPGDLILLMTWKSSAAADAYERPLNLHEDARIRRVRVIRDYGKYDRREAPQYYPDASGATTIHA
jgi:hypothetical protein